MWKIWYEILEMWKRMSEMNRWRKISKQHVGVSGSNPINR